MARPTGASSAPKKDWRARQAQEESTSGGRYFRRFFFTLLLAGLAVWLGMLLFPGCGPKPHLVLLPIADYEMTVSPVPYATQNVEELKTRLEGREIDFNLWDDLQTSKSLASLANRLQPISKPRDVLMLYMSTHGVSENGNAYLLCSDYQPRANPEGRFELGELIEQIRVCKAKLKLLILDVASIAVDPRLGFVVNEFPRLAEAKVRETADPDLYVLLSQSPLEQSHLAHRARRSVFNYYVVEGLRGAANRTDENDYLIDLEELYAFVRSGVAARTAQQTDERETQLPLLLRGGEGVCRTVPKGLALLKVLPEPSGKKAAEDAKKGAADAKADEKEADRPADKADRTEKSKGDANAPDAGSETAKSGLKPKSPPTSAGAAERGAKGGAPVADPPEPKTTSAATSKDASAAVLPKKAAEAADKGSPPAKAEKKAGTGEKEEKKKAEGKGEKGEGKGDKGEEKGEKTEGKPDAAGKPAEEEPGPAAVAPAAETGPASAPALLTKAWQQRDRAQVRQGANAWSPVDYAPHLWREYNELLLGFELRHRYGVEFRKERLDALRDLAEGRENISGFGEASILGRLHSAQQQFLGDADKLKRFEQARSEGLGEIEEAMKLRNDMMFAVPYYVRWHAQAAMTSSAESPLYQRIATLLDDEHLPKLVHTLEMLDQIRPSDTAQRQKALVDLRTARRQVEEARTDLEDGAYGLRRVAEELLKGPSKRLADLRAIEGLLSIPLLSAAVRGRLIERLRELDPPLELAAQRRSRAATEPTPPLRSWERYGEQLRLETALAKLADRDFKPAVEPTAAYTPHLAKSDGEVWEEYRKLGHGLGEFYQTMPDRIGQSYDSPQIADVQTAARLFRLMDARDVSGRSLEKAAGIVMVAPPRSDVSQIKLAVPDKATLARNEAWTPVDMELKLSGPCGDQARLRLEFETARIEVVDRDSKQPIVVGDQRPIRLDRNKTDQSISVRLNLRPKGNLTWTESLLTVRATAEKATANGELRLELPPPDVVDVVVERVIDLVTGEKVPADRISGSQGGGREQLADVLCDAFPNRTTEYVVSLKNRSGKPKKVAVELYSPPPSTADSIAPLVGPLDRWGKPLPGYRNLAAAAELELDAAGTAMAIPFAETKAEPKKDEEAKKPAEKGEKKAKSEPDRPLVSRGLACVIYDLLAKDPKPAPQVRWLRFRPVAPRQYLQPAVKYEQGRITIQVRPLEVKSLPRLSEDTPIKIDWNVQGTIDPNARMSTHAEIQSPDQTRELFADVPPKAGREIPVQLAVDGYPRAFVFRVPTDRPLRIEELRDLRDVRISAPRPGEAYKIPLAAPIFTEFQADAPADAFRNWGADRPRDVIEVTMEVPGERSFVMQDRLQFYSDRQFEARVQEVGAAGLLKIDARVHDFKVPLSPGELKNAEVAVRVAMTLTSAEGVAGAGRDVKTATVRVIFDAAKPTVRLIEAPRAPVLQGNNVAVIVEVKDPDPGSGVAKIEYGLRDGDLSDFDEKDKPDQVLPPNIQPQTKLPPLPTKELKPGKYALLARVTDRVGWQTTQRLAFVEIAEPPPPPPKPDENQKGMPVMSSISGRAVLGSADANVTWIGLKVTLKELNRTVTAGADGRFEFPDVPPGPYTLEGKGIGGNKLVKGSTNVTVTEKPAKVDLPME